MNRFKEAWHRFKTDECGGCNCGGKKAAVSTPVSRNTVYQTLNAQREVVGEFQTIQEARTEAVRIGGIVRVSSKP